MYLVHLCYFEISAGNLCQFYKKKKIKFAPFLFKVYCDVRSRQNVIKDHTIQWIEKHYPGLFEEIHFGNHFALDGESRPKSEICRYAVHLSCLQVFDAIFPNCCL